MRPIIIRNGCVYDPVNGLNGEITDIFIENGKIEEKKPKNAKIIDVEKRVVMPGGIDSHSHIAGPKINIGRLMCPEDSRKYAAKKGELTRAGTGSALPSTFITGYLYAKMGYTTVFEPAMPPLLARHTHDELNDTPIIDKGAFTILGNNWHVMKYLSEGELEKCAAYVAWVIRATGGYAIKLVNPGGDELWGWGRNVHTIYDEVDNFGITPAEIINGLATINELLGLPHSIHLHPNNLGIPGNYKTTLDTFKLFKRYKQDIGRQALYVAHAQFHSYGGSTWSDFESKADEISKYINSHKNIAIDVGFVPIENTVTLTADGPLEYHLNQITGMKWTNYDVEAETSGGITPFVYSPSSMVNAVQWATGLELALMAKDPSRVMISTDHPNGGPFTLYPLIIAWLMSEKFRESYIDGINNKVIDRSKISDLGREYSLVEIAMATRAGQAKALGLKSKGQLSVGSDADIAVYDIRHDSFDESKDWETIIKAFSRAYLTIKNGEVVVKKGKIVNVPYGKTYCVNTHIPQDLLCLVLDEVAVSFENYYTVRLDNYPVEDKYIRNKFSVVTNGKIGHIKQPEEGESIAISK